MPWSSSLLQSLCNCSPFLLNHFPAHLRACYYHPWSLSSQSVFPTSVPCSYALHLVILWFLLSSLESLSLSKTILLIDGWIDWSIDFLIYQRMQVFWKLRLSLLFYFLSSRIVSGTLEVLKKVFGVKVRMELKAQTMDSDTVFSNSSLRNCLWALINF